MEADELPLPWIDEGAIATSFPTLFHYTKIERLEKILEAGVVFGTHYQHTNDREEFRAAANPFAMVVRKDGLELAQRRRAQGAFNRHIDDFALAQLVAGDAKLFHGAMLKAMPTPPFITCFARHTRPNHHENGLLTLWRFYGGEGRGVALGFNTQTLIQKEAEIRSAFALNAMFLDTVGYGDEDDLLRSRLAQAPKLSAMYLSYLDSVLASNEVDLGNRRDEIFQFIVLASCAKHPDFVDEREVRLITIPTEHPDERLRPRAESVEGKHVRLPFVDALEKVMIGPSEDQDELADRARIALTQAGMPHVRLVRSRTPFMFARN